MNSRRRKKNNNTDVWHPEKCTSEKPRSRLSVKRVFRASADSLLDISAAKTKPLSTRDTLYNSGSGSDDLIHTPLTGTEQEDQQAEASQLASTRYQRSRGNMVNIVIKDLLNLELFFFGGWRRVGCG